MKKIIVVGLVILLLLTACGGNNTTTSEPAANTDTGSTSSTEENTAAPAATETPMMEEATSEEPTAVESEEPAAEETATEEPAAQEEDMTEETAADDPYGGRPLTGIDPETGLEINPAEVLKGTEFIIRGKVISMNLTPQTAPEFLIESPDGIKYRVHSQGLSDIYLVDGSQLQAFQYRLGMLAQATVYQDPAAGVTSVVETDDLLLLTDGQ